MDGRTLTFFASDVHLGLDFKDPAAREKSFVSFLRSIPADRTESLYLLGDIWDFWYEYRDVVPKGYVRVFAALLDLQDAGVKIYFFPGNHDLWCYNYFRELGFTVLEQPYLVRIGKKTFCLGHGDGLGPVSFGYALMHRAFTWRPLQVLFSTLHPWLAFRLGNGWSHNRRTTKDVKEYVFEGEGEPLWKWADAYSRDHQVDYFIFGHYHSHFEGFLPSGARLLLLKDWFDSPSFAYFDGMNVCFGCSINIEK